MYVPWRSGSGSGSEVGEFGLDLRIWWCGGVEVKMEEKDQLHGMVLESSWTESWGLARMEAGVVVVLSQCYLF